MTVINLPRDDQGIMRLQGANAARRITPPISALTAGSGVNPQRSPSLYIPEASPAERRHNDRRGGSERRARRQPTLLDTRDHRERRAHERRVRTRLYRDRQYRRGINFYI